MRILVIEDDPKISRFLSQGLEADGHVVECVDRGDRALERMCAGRNDLVLLDVMLPGADGLEILRSFRQRDSTTPVFILSARGAVDDRIVGLDLGADDYLVKPFSFVELQARMRAFFRRERTRPDARYLTAGELVLDRTERRVQLGARSEELTAREFQLLDYFMSNPGQPLTRSILADRVWGYRFDTGTNVVDVYVNYLRRKLSTVGCHPIRTLRGIGYVFDAPTAEEALHG
jgi:DNA-binding response OmpR family regulator